MKINKWTINEELLIVILRIEVSGVHNFRDRFLNKVWFAFYRIYSKARDRFYLIFLALEIYDKSCKTLETGHKP